MSGKLIRVVAAAVISTTALACGGDEGPKAVTANTYVSGVCSAISSWMADFQTRAAALTEEGLPQNPEESKELFDGFLGDTVTEIGRLIEEVRKVGVPDVEEGEEAAQQIVTALTQVKSAYEDAQQDFSELPTNNREAYGVGVSEIIGSIQEATSEATGSINVVDDSEELSEAFEKSDECAQLREGP